MCRREEERLRARALYMEREEGKGRAKCLSVEREKGKGSARAVSLVPGREGSLGPRREEGDGEEDGSSLLHSLVLPVLRERLGEAEGEALVTVVHSLQLSVSSPLAALRQLEDLPSHWADREQRSWGLLAARGLATAARGIHSTTGWLKTLLPK